MSTRRVVGVALLALAGSGVYLVLAARQRSRSDRSAHFRPVRVQRAVATAGEKAVEERGTRDGASVNGRLVAATAAGLRLAGDERTFTFGEAEVTAMTVHRGRVVLGAVDGTVTMVTARPGEPSETLTFEGFGHVTELASDGERLYVGTADGLVVWDDRARTPVEAVGTITAMAVGPGGVAIGTAEGDLWVSREGTLERVGDRVGDRVSALAWDGDDLLVGTPFALLRVTGGEVRTVRRDLHVTAVLLYGGRLYLGTFDDGVVEVDAHGRERRLVGREHVRRLRVVDDRPVAFGDGGAWDLSGPAASRLV